MLVQPGESLLDIGCGSATSWDAIRAYFPDKNIKYKGVDFIDHRIEFCKEPFPGAEFEVQNAMKLSEKDNSWDTVWSRHVVDHLQSFEEPMEEYLRVAKKRVICILFNSWTGGPEHEINQIKDYQEWLNIYSKEKVVKWLESKKPEWNHKIIENVGLNPVPNPIPNVQQFAARDIIIHIYK